MIKRVFLSLLAFLMLPTMGQAQVGGGSAVYQNWFPQANSPSVSVTTSSAAHLYPGLGPTARVCNTGSVDAYVNPQGTSNIVVATTNSFWVKADTCQPYNIKPSTTQFTYFAAITASGSTTLYVETGLGAPGTLAGAATAPVGAAGGQLTGTYPNPSIVPGLFLTNGSSAQTYLGQGTPDVESQYYFAYTLSASPANNKYALRGNINLNFSGDSNAYASVLGYTTVPAVGGHYTGIVRGVYGAVDNNGTSIVDQAYAVYGPIINRSTGTLTHAANVFVYTDNLGTGTISDNDGIEILTPINSGGGVFSSFRGLHIHDPTSAVPSGYGVVVDGGKSTFAGFVAVGSGTDPTQALDVTGNARFSGNLIFGTMGSTIGLAAGGQPFLQLNTGEILAAGGQFRINNAASLVLAQSTPASSDACTAGAVAADASYIYFCPSSGAWRRVATTGSY